MAWLGFTWLYPHKLSYIAVFHHQRLNTTIKLQENLANRQKEITYNGHNNDWSQVGDVTWNVEMATKHHAVGVTHIQIGICVTTTRGWYGMAFIQKLQLGISINLITIIIVIVCHPSVMFCSSGFGGRSLYSHTQVAGAGFHSIHSRRWLYIRANSDSQSNNAKRKHIRKVVTS